ncbi:hypothetical protein F4778DRAFT_294756 [Xylariomycetidae sp. FL2044]|nr:hypothetical protein F4778DRAFT_294756 [Xylariomycetidae sp. FL2044]
MPVTFEGNNYICSITNPDIPYTIWVHENHLLLVPRQVPKVHKAFPSVPAARAQQRFTLQLGDHIVKQYQQQYGRAPTFTSRGVQFGYEEDEGVVVAALLPGSNLIPYWDFQRFLNRDATVVREHFTDETSDPQAGFGIMAWDLRQAA